MSLQEELQIKLPTMNPSLPGTARKLPDTASSHDLTRGGPEELVCVLTFHTGLWQEQKHCRACKARSFGFVPKTDLLVPFQHPTWKSPNAAPSGNSSLCGMVF